MSFIKKANEISDAKIAFISLVDRAANQQKFLIVKADNYNADFTMTGEILKADSEKHTVTGIVYEPDTEDSQGDFMTAEEIEKAAHYFLKNGGKVDIQHSFKEEESAVVVESYVTKSDGVINGHDVKKGTWIATVEINDDDIFKDIEDGKITGFSMGGTGRYTESELQKRKGLLEPLAKMLGFNVVEKGKMTAEYNRRCISDNFRTAYETLRQTLESYDCEKGCWKYIDDEQTVKTALKEFNDIVTKLLTEKEIAKMVFSERKVQKAGKKMSKRNKDTLSEICQSLNMFMKEFDENENEEEDSMNEKDLETITNSVTTAVTGAIQPLIDAIGTLDDNKDDEVNKDDEKEKVDEAVEKALQPLKEQVESIVKALGGNTTNLNNNQSVKKSSQHYMAGMF